MFQTNSVCHWNITELKCQDVKLNQTVMDLAGNPLDLKKWQWSNNPLIRNKSSLGSNISSMSVMFSNTFLFNKVQGHSERVLKVNSFAQA